MRNSLRKNLWLALVFFLISVAVFLWLPYARFSTERQLLLSLGQVTSLVGYCLYMINFILSSRSKWLDNLFFGLNRTYLSHHLIGISAFLLLLLHPIFIILSYLTVSLDSALYYVLPSIKNSPTLFGSMALLSTIILLVITLYIKIEYNRWKITHKFLGLGLLFATLHIIFIGSTLSLNFPLRIYFYLLTLAAFVSYIKWTLLGKFLMKKTVYRVFSVVKTSLHVRLILRPEKEKLQYYPGQFVFVEFPGKGILSQSHPFSIASSSDADYIELGIKTVGTYTERIASLKKGEKVLLDGPYGRFSYKYYRNGSLVWIAGGIGVVPFVAMAKELPDNTKAILFYSVKDRSEALYFKELVKVSKQNNKFRLILWESSKRGRFTAKDISDILPDAGYFICGPEAMMKSLSKQLLSEGVPYWNIHTEEFSLT